MCDFQIDYRFFNSKSSTIKTEKIWKWNVTLKVPINMCMDVSINKKSSSNLDVPGGETVFEIP